jgi:hypothetical protein
VGYLGYRKVWSNLFAVEGHLAKRLKYLYPS